MGTVKHKNWRNGMAKNKKVVGSKICSSRFDVASRYAT